MINFISDYLNNLNQSFSDKNFDQINEFCKIVEDTIKNKNIYIYVEMVVVPQTQFICLQIST